MSSAALRPLTWAEPVRGYPPPTLRRRALAWRYALACLPPAIGAVAMPALEGLDVLMRVQSIIDLALVPVSFVIIRWRRSHPLAVALTLSALVSLSSLSYGFWAWGVVSMATRRRWRWVGAVGAVTVGAALVTLMLSGSVDGLTLTTPDGVEVPVTDWAILVGLALATTFIIYLALVAWGFYIGARRDLVASLTERAENAEREQALRAAQIHADERARIAREMHDVLAHRISLVSMHAGILAFRDDLPPEQTRQVAAIIQENAAESLTELRAVLGALREPGATPAKPQPTLADVPALVEDAQAAGTHVEVEDAVDRAAPLPPTIGRHAYRIVQEALTNARKHAVGSPVRVSLSGRPGSGLALEVTNPLTTGAGLPGAGLGLVGLAERAQIAGGWCTARPEEGRFIVRAWLPWQT